MVTKQQILQHYKANEQDFVKEYLAFKEDVVNNNKVKVTGFLTVREQDILKSIIGKQANISFDFGMLEGERAIAIINNVELPKEFKQTTILKIDYNKKFAILKHGDVLGAIIGLGLERKVIGDIVFQDSDIYVVVKKEIAEYISDQLTTVGKHSVKVLLNNEVIVPTTEDFNKKTIYVSSLRLDSLLSHVLSINREREKQLIIKNFVRVNWCETQNINQSYTENSIISVRKFGRIYIDNISQTKRDRFKIDLRLT